MSDMYLVLRRRLTEVKNWVPLGSAVMKAARDAHGWSYETTARKIPVSSKTYERYEKRGAVPVEMVERVAAVLGLVIERPDFRTVVTLPANGRREEAFRRLDEMEQGIAAVRELLGDDPGGSDAPDEETG